MSRMQPRGRNILPLTMPMVSLARTQTIIQPEDPTASCVPFLGRSAGALLLTGNSTHWIAREGCMEEPQWLAVHVDVG
jgi:hypothetical protein